MTANPQPGHLTHGEEGQHVGPCARCHTPIRRYGPNARTLCPDCYSQLDRNKKDD